PASRASAGAAAAPARARRFRSGASQPRPLQESNGASRSGPAHAVPRALLYVVRPRLERLCSSALGRRSALFGFHATSLRLAQLLQRRPSRSEARDHEAGSAKGVSLVGLSTDQVRRL